jgi:hypothetical protein
MGIDSGTKLGRRRTNAAEDVVRFRVFRWNLRMPENGPFADGGGWQRCLDRTMYPLPPGSR